MPDYDVTYLDAGRVTSRRVAAAEMQAVAAALGVHATHLLQVRPASTTAARGLQWPRFNRFPLRQFSQELSVLLQSGIPLLEALQTLREKEAHPEVARVLQGLAASLQEGASLSAAASRQARAFDELFIAMVAAAERSGQLETALQQHARHLAWVQALRHQLLGACIYPLLLVTASGAVLLFLLMFVVPRFAGVLEGTAGGLPEGSRLLMQAGLWSQDHPLALLGSVATALVLSVAAALTPAGRGAATRLAWALPFIGERLRLLALARLLRTTSMLLGAGVPVLTALRAARSVTAPRLRAALDAAAADVDRGLALSVALDAAGLATPVSSRMVRVGERSGTLGEMLGRAAAFYDEELLRLSETVTRLINPLLMLLMGGLIGTVVVLLYLPIFQLAEQVQ